MASSQANVGSLEALKDFQSAYCRFADEMEQALAGIDIQIRRGLDWLEHDQLNYWQSEIRRRERQVTEARTDLMRARMASIGDTPSCTEQEIAWQRAKRRLEAAEEKVKLIKHWSIVLRQEIDDYQSQAQPLRNYLEMDQRRGVALLERMLDILESYIAMSSPGAASRGDVPSVARPAEEPRPDTTAEKG